MRKILTPRVTPLLALTFALAGSVGLISRQSGDTPLVARQVAVTPAVSNVAGAVTDALPDVAIETASGAHTHFAATDGYVRVVTLFYSHCPGVCPMTIDTLRDIDRKLSAQQRAKLHFVLLSLDPARDTPAALRTVAVEREIDSRRWLLGRTAAQDVAAVAAAARIQYRPLSDGSIDHSTALVLLDTNGRVLTRTGDVDDPAAFVTAVRAAIDATGAR